MGKRVVLAMSGGVDSSVAAVLLKAQGFEVVGVFMRTGAVTEDTERRAKTCCSVADALDAQSVADRLDIAFYALDFERDFARIKDYFSDEYLAGRTPNPCVVCNIWLKFGKLWSYGKQVGADFVATGHYARLVRDANGISRVARAVDRAKDQSYVLFGLRRELLPHIRFPVGGFTKSEIRAIAASTACRCTTSRTARRFASFRATITCPLSEIAGPIEQLPARLSMRRELSWASTPESKRSRLASDGGWESPWVPLAMSFRSSPSPTR